MTDFACAYPIDLSVLHTFGLKSRASRLCVVSDSVGLASLAKAWKAGEDPLILGEGSNTVFLAERVDRPIFKMALTGRKYLGIRNSSHVFRVSAGENWHSWVEWSVQSGFPGLENLALIPGAVGAAPVQNIGAYGLELVDRILGVHVFDLESEVFSFLDVSDCGFGYRDSVFKQVLSGKVLITAVDFALPVVWKPVLGYGDVEARFLSTRGQTASDLLEAIIAIRSSKLPDPTVLGNSGSFFKNPIVAAPKASELARKFEPMPTFPAADGQVKLAAGWLIDNVGLKGFECGGVGVYEKQALILINRGGGSATDLRSLVARIVDEVNTRFGVLLEPEPNLIM